LTAYRALNGEDFKKVIPLAAALELIHTATLIHDDINDRSILRRGIPTAHEKFGTNKALLTGDYLFTKAMEIVNEYEKEIRDVIVDSCIILTIGEITQSHNIQNFELSEDKYLEIIKKKTARPISACSETGGIIAGIPKNQIICFRDYGLNLGIGFQIIDDILDVIGTDTEVGKYIGNDLCEGKPTILSIHALKHSKLPQRERLKEVLVKNDNTTEEILEGIEIIKDTGSVDYARKLSKEYGEKAKEAISVLPDSEGREEMERLADLAVNRSH
jgi:geranylgeranyl pyrophosphate synthase